ncbi:hypothetical protein BOTNAR_0066g00040 [Botryotinia narcissicola]|uniref:Uncharacterized protein n=1 Tax=Botryotinia narcissicola TaxID=278944 RepID=A0A4Z1IXS4_9HELO|nr:hypothetical protein BOTNAR_0066g00040 [Botryotinia narcissicola]
MAGRGGSMVACTVAFMPTILGNETMKFGRPLWMVTILRLFVSIMKALRLPGPELGGKCDWMLGNCLLTTIQIASQSPVLTGIIRMSIFFNAKI